MSYDIIYDKQFIKAGENLYVPMILAGSNNCIQYDRSDRGRRSRSWEAWGYLTPDHMKMSTPELMLKQVDEIRQGCMESYNGEADEDGRVRDKYDDKKFGYFNSIAIRGHWAGTTFGAFRGIITTGVKKALTVEQLKEEGVGVNISMYDYNGESKKEAEKLGLPWLGTTHITDSLHLVESIKLYYQTYKGTNFSWHVGFDEYNLENKMKWIRKKYFPKDKNKTSYETVQVDSYYTVVAPNGYYFYKRIKYGYRYSGYPQHKFATEKQANSFANRLKDRLVLKVELVNEKGWVKVAKKPVNNLVD